MSRRGLASSGVLRSPSTRLYAKRADDLVETAAINVCWGMPSDTGGGEYADQSRPHYNNPITAWGPKLADIGFRYARQCLGFSWPYNLDNPDSSPVGWQSTMTQASNAMNYLDGLGLKLGYTMWVPRDYTWLATGAFPKPAWLEGANEPPYPTYNQMYAANPQFAWSLSGRGVAPNATQYNVGDMVGASLFNGFVAGSPPFVCIKQHTPTAGNTPPLGSNQIYYKSEFWQTSLALTCGNTMQWADSLMSTVPGWSTGIDLVAPSTVSTVDQMTPVQKASVASWYRNFHDYHLPNGSQEPAWYTYHDPASPNFITNDWNGSYQRGYITEFTAWRCGPADGISAVSETDAAKMWVRSFAIGHYVFGFRKLVGWMATEHVGDNKEGQTCNPVQSTGYPTVGYQGRAGLIYKYASGGGSAGAGYKVPAVWLKRLFGIYGERNVGRYVLTGLLPVWASRDSRLVETLHERSDGKLLYGFVLNVEPTADEGTNNFTVTEDTPTGNPDGMAILGTVGKYQNGKSMTKLTNATATTVSFDRTFSNVESYDFSTGNWTTIGARAAGQAVSVQATETFKILRLTP